jgi:hypothetical protein
LIIKPSLTSTDGIRVYPLLLSGIQATDDGLKVRCNIAYQADPSNNVYRGTVTSGDLVMRVATINSFTASQTDPIVGNTLSLTCIATGSSAPTFSLTTDERRSFEDTFLTTPVELSAVSSVGTTHTVKYETQATRPNVLRGGQVIYCQADYGKKQRIKKKLTVINYYNCSSVRVKSFIRDVSGATVTQTDLGSGSLRQIINCPADTDTTRYVLLTGTISAAEITCTKETGKYIPPHLARCGVIQPFSKGSGRQILSIRAEWAAPCSTEEDSAGSEFSTSIVNQKLNSLTDTNCGFRHKVTCLTNGKCKLDTNKSGCRYDAESRLMTNEYHVIFTPPVWNVSEKDALLRLTGGLIRFWRCSRTYG